jgi:hypothetical protein
MKQRSGEFGDFFQTFAAALPKLFYLLVHLQILKLEKDVLLLEAVQIPLEEGQLLEVLLELEELLEVFVLLEFLVEEAVQVEADLVVEEVHETEPLADEALGDGGVLEAEVHELALVEHLPQSFPDDLLPVGFLVDGEVVDHVVDAGDDALLLEGVADEDFLDFGLR